MLVFNGARLMTARQYRCLTMDELSNRTGISSKTIRKHETGKSLPTKENQEHYSAVLKFPLSFWLAEKVENINPKDVSFRSFRRVPAWVKGRAISEAQIAVDVILRWMNNRFYLPEVNFCQLPEQMTAEESAKYLRMFWQIGCLPVEHLIHFLEGKGIRIFSFSLNIRSLDACSFWTQDNQPVILIDYSRSAERIRFSLMHEVGHLLMHKDHLVHNRVEEEEADAFSSSFLMPEPAFSQDAPNPESFDALIAYKRYWGVSLSALYYRLHKIGMMSDCNYRSKMISLNKIFGHTKEPSPIQSETSSLFSKVVDVLKKHGETSISLASELGLPDDILRNLCFGLPGEVVLHIVKEVTDPVYVPQRANKYVHKRSDQHDNDEIRWTKDESAESDQILNPQAH